MPFPFSHAEAQSLGQLWLVDSPCPHSNMHQFPSPVKSASEIHLNALPPSELGPLYLPKEWTQWSPEGSGPLRVPHTHPSFKSAQMTFLWHKTVLAIWLPRPAMASHCLWMSMNTSPTSWACFPFWLSCLGFPHTPGAEAHLVYLLFSNRIPSFPYFHADTPICTPNTPWNTISNVTSSLQPFPVTPAMWASLPLMLTSLLCHLFSTWSQEHSVTGGSWVTDTCTNASLHSRVWAGALHRVQG